MRVKRHLHRFAEHFHSQGYECFLVGGALRNLISGAPATDYDFATDALPEDVRRIFKRVIPTGIKHGTVTVLFEGHQYEVTTYRIEGKYSDSRRPDHVQFTPSIEEDLKRRDFTMNAIALDLYSGKLLDPHHGKRDINAKIIRAIGNAVERFTEDPLRMLRACRFASQLDFSIEAGTLQGIADSAQKIDLVSAERVRDEIEKMLLSDKPSKGIRLMETTGLLPRILPELSQCKGIRQKGLHHFDVFTHSLVSCDKSEKNIVIRLAALLHDIGKADTLSLNDAGEPTFYRHEHVSAEIAGLFLRKYKFPRFVENRVCHLIKNHMFLYEESWTDSAVRRFVVRVGKDSIPDLFKLRCADHAGMTGEYGDCPMLVKLRERIDEIFHQQHAISISDLQVNGHILAKEADIPKGPEMGKVLSFLLEAVLDDPSMNEHKRLVSLAREFYQQYMKMD